MVDIDKLKKSIKQLENALHYEDKIKDDSFYMAGISKIYEVSLEYFWKYLRNIILDQGFDEIYGPKDTIRKAAQINLINNPEIWIDFINQRNLAVHDYAKITDEDYLQSAKDYLKEVKKIKFKN